MSNTRRLYDKTKTYYCKCGCGSIEPEVILKINNNKYIVIEKYKGCNYCVVPITTSILFFDKKGFEDYYGKYYHDKIEPVEFSEDGGTPYHVNYFSQDDMCKAAEDLDINPSGYDSLSDLISDYGLDLIQDSIKIFEEESALREEKGGDKK